MKTIIRAAGCLGLLLAVAIAADVSGKWTGDMPGRGGDTTPTTFNFKGDGEKLTGTMMGPAGRYPASGREDRRESDLVLDDAGFRWKLGQDRL